MAKSILVLALVFAAVPAIAQDRGWIGVSILDRPEGGVLVRSVEANSPAERAGLRANDVIVRYNGQDVVGVLQLTRLVTETPIGRSVDILARRDNKEQNFKVTTERARTTDIHIRTPDLPALSDRIIQRIPNINIHASVSATHSDGVHVQDLTPQLREYFGVKEGLGVLVMSVDANSAAAKAGLRAGDIIIAVDGRPVATPSEFGREIRATSRTQTFRIVREKQERDLQITP